MTSQKDNHIPILIAPYFYHLPGKMYRFTIFNPRFLTGLALGAKNWVRQCKFDPITFPLSALIHMGGFVVSY